MKNIIISNKEGGTNLEKNKIPLWAKFKINSILKKLNKSNNENLDFINDFEEWLEEQEETKWKSRDDIATTFKRIFKSFAVPKFKTYNWDKNGTTNLDSKSCLLLLRLSWFNTKNKFKISNHKNIPKIEKQLNINLWTFDWVEIEWEETNWLNSFYNKSSISINNTTRKISSSTRIVYEYLEKLWQFDDWKKEQIKRFVSFIDIVDWAWVQINSINIKWFAPFIDWSRTLFWLAKNIPIDVLFEQFEKEITWFEILSDEELEKIKTPKWNGLELSTDKELDIAESIWKINNLIEDWNILKYNNQKLEFVVNFWEILKDKIQLMSYFKKWIIDIKENWDIFIFNPKSFTKKFEWIWAVTKSKICVIKSNEKLYINKLDSLLELLSSNKQLKIQILEELWIRWKLLEKIEPKIKKQREQRQKEINDIIKNKKEEAKERKRNKKEKFTNQKLNIDELKKWETIYWSMQTIRNNSEIPVFISWLKWAHWWKIITSPRRIKSKEQTKNILIEKRFWGSKIELINKFVISRLDEEKKLIKLVQI